MSTCSLSVGAPRTAVALTNVNSKTAIATRPSLALLALFAQYIDGWRVVAPTSQTGHSKSCDHNVIVYPGDYHNATEYGSNPCQTDDNSVFANQCVLSASCTSLLSPLLLPARSLGGYGFVP